MVMIVGDSFCCQREQYDLYRPFDDGHRRGIVVVSHRQLSLRHQHLIVECLRGHEVGRRAKVAVWWPHKSTEADK